MVIPDYCRFQYGIINRDKPKNKPHSSYVKLLDEHRLWIDYLETVNTPKDKEEDTDTDKDPDKEIEKASEEDREKDSAKDIDTDTNKDL